MTERENERVARNCIWKSDFDGKTVLRSEDSCKSEIIKALDSKDTTHAKEVAELKKKINK